MHGPDFDTLSFDGEFLKLKTENPQRLSSSQLSEQDVDPLKTVWRRLAGLRRLDQFKRQMQGELLFSRIDTHVATLMRVGDIDSLALYFEEEAGISIPMKDPKSILAAIHDMQAEDTQPPPTEEKPSDSYWRLFVRRFKEIRAQHMGNASRIVRQSAAISQTASGSSSPGKAPCR